MPEQVLPASENFAHAECRVYERHSVGLNTACRPASAFASKEAAWSAVISDISLGGVRLTLRRRFEPGTALAVEVPATEHSEPYTVFAKVVYAKVMDDGAWTLGCKFVSELSEGELERVLSSLRRPTATPVQAGRVTTVASKTELHEPSERGILRDLRFRLLTRRGALIECVIRRFKVGASWPLSPGKLTSLRAGKGGPLSKLRVQVLECAQQDGHWTLECRLAQTPSAAKLWRALAALEAHLQ